MNEKKYKVTMFFYNGNDLEAARSFKQVDSKGLFTEEGNVCTKREFVLVPNDDKTEYIPVRGKVRLTCDEQGVYAEISATYGYGSDRVDVVREGETKIIRFNSHEQAYGERYDVVACNAEVTVKACD